MHKEDILAERAPYYDDASESYRKRMAVVNMLIFFNQFSGSSTTFALAHYVFPQVAGPAAATTTWCYAKLALLQVVVTFLAGQFL